MKLLFLEAKVQRNLDPASFFLNSFKEKKSNY